MTPTLRRAAVVGAAVAALASCSSSGNPAASAGHSASPSPSPSAEPSAVPLTAQDVQTPGATVAASAGNPSGDARVRTLLTWCTHTAATEDAAPTTYGPTLTLRGPHGANTVYSYVRALPDGTATDAAAYQARLLACWRSTLLPVLAAGLDVHIDHLTFATSVTPLPLAPLPAGSAVAVEGVVRWHPTPATTEASTYDAAVVFGARTETTILAAGADGLTTGLQHLTADVNAVTASRPHG